MAREPEGFEALVWPAFVRALQAPDFEMNFPELLLVADVPGHPAGRPARFGTSLGMPWGVLRLAGGRPGASRKASRGRGLCFLIAVLLALNCDQIMVVLAVRVDDIGCVCVVCVD